jgi:hypothetical protein
VKPIHRSDGVVLRSIAERLAAPPSLTELLALSADLVSIAGVVGRLQKRHGRPRNGDPVTTARYHITDYPAPHNLRRHPRDTR